MDTRPPALEAAGLGLATRRGAVYRDISLVVPAGSFAMLVGSTGSGKTALLLTLAGRMHATSGTLRSFGDDARRRPATARTRTALGLVAGVNDLSDHLTVGDHVREALAMQGRRSSDALVRASLTSVGLEIDPRAKAGALSAIDRELLGIALALTSRPDVIAVDDADHDLTRGEQERLMSVLRDTAGSGTTVIAACVDERLSCFADVVIGIASAFEEEVPCDEVALAR